MKFVIDGKKYGSDFDAMYEALVDQFLATSRTPSVT